MRLIDCDVSVQSEDDIELTPEQQRQLAMIDNMPLTIEKEITPEEWDLKSPEEKERMIGKPCSILRLLKSQELCVLD